MTSTIRLPENNGLETCHSMLVFRHILGRKDIKLEVQNFVLMIRTQLRTITSSILKFVRLLVRNKVK